MIRTDFLARNLKKLLWGGLDQTKWMQGKKDHSSSFIPQEEPKKKNWTYVISHERKGSNAYGTKFGSVIEGLGGQGGGGGVAS